MIVVWAFIKTFWKPIALVLIALALVVTFGLAKRHYDNSKIAIGEARVQAKWDAAIAAQKAREARAAAEAEDFANRLDAKRQKDFDDLKKRTVAAENELARVRIAASLAASLRDTVRAANGEDARAPAKDSAATAEPPSGLTVAKWFDIVGEQYRACREQVMEIVKWDDARVAQ